MMLWELVSSACAWSGSRCMWPLTMEGLASERRCGEGATLFLTTHMPRDQYRPRTSEQTTLQSLFTPPRCFLMATGIRSSRNPEVSR